MGRVAEAERLEADVAPLREQAAAPREEARALLEGVETWDPEERKALGWAKQDEAVALDRRADVLRLEARSRLQGALSHEPRLAEAHAALAERFRRDHAEAEAGRDPDAAVRAEIPLRNHVAALPEGHPVRAPRRSAGVLLEWPAGGDRTSP